MTRCIGILYHRGTALLDREESWKVIHRTHPYILNPRELDECVGDVPNVVFPTASLTQVRNQ